MAQRLPRAFTLKKDKILQALSVDAGSYSDASPKGSVDEEIVPLIELLNAAEGWVSTSSCSGRVSVWVEPPSPNLQPGPDRAGVENSQDHVEHVDVRKNTANGADGTLPNKTSEGNDASKRKRNFGKGSGGRWLFVSHERIVDNSSLLQALGVDTSENQDIMREVASDSASSAQNTDDAVALVHFKFEPMILHVLTASNNHAQKLLSAALQAGFRESGAVNIASTSTSNASTYSRNSVKDVADVCPMVGIRTTGLALDCIVGMARLSEVRTIAKSLDPQYGDSQEEIRTSEKAENIQTNPKISSLVSRQHLELLITTANARFEANSQRIRRLEELVRNANSIPTWHDESWEDGDVRRARLRAEGLARRDMLKQNRAPDAADGVNEVEDQEDDSLELGMLS